MRARRHNRLTRRAFTLIELLLALAIFTVIAIATARTLQQIRNTKDAAFRDLDRYSAMRTALAVLRDDVRQAFHVLYNDLGRDAVALLSQARPTPHTLLDGRKNSLVLTSVSHRVYYKNRRESEQAELSFFLQEKGKGRNSSLMKRESGRIDADPYQGGAVYTLLDDVTSLEFQYWDPVQGKWVDDWNSDGGNYRDKFPPSVKVKLVAMGEENQQLQAETQIKIAFPNNDELVVRF